PHRGVGLVVVERDRDHLVEAGPGDRPRPDRRDIERRPKDDDDGYDDPRKPALPGSDVRRDVAQVSLAAHREFGVRRRFPGLEKPERYDEGAQRSENICQRVVDEVRRYELEEREGAAGDQQYGPQRP